LLTALLQPEIQAYIREHTHIDVKKLALQKNPFPQVPWTDVLNQIAARQKAKDKLPTWFTTENIIYPSKISVEQTSSETAAKYKAKLVSGVSLIDLTGGFGIDDYYFSKQLKEVTHCELNPELSAIAQHNFEVLGATNIQCIPGDSYDTLTEVNRQWDYIYIDPSRRNDAKGKVFMLADCLPNVPELLDTYFNFTKNILVKTAPLLDISAGINELHSVKAIHIVAINNEVKELLWILEKGFTETPALIATDLNKDGEQVFKAQYGNEDIAPLSLPKKYLYEPNSAVMKSGAFGTVASHYKLAKLHAHSQLYTSDELIDFAGRRFEIQQILPYGKAEMKQYIQGKKMNITVRNFPLKTEELQRKWKIKDGGDVYTFFTTNREGEKMVLICGKK
jgi:hypothetical protein